MEVISVFINKLYEISGDDYTYLYLPYQYIYSSERESARGASCRFAPYNCDTAYLNITNFTDESSEFVYDNVDKLTNYKNLILDLRNNPGGYVDSAEEIAEIFLDKDSIIYSEHTLNGTFDKTVKTKNDAMLRFDKKMCIRDRCVLVWNIDRWRNNTGNIYCDEIYEEYRRKSGGYI